MISALYFVRGSSVKKMIRNTLLVLGLMATPVAWSYDSNLAESYARLFSTVSGAGAGKALHLVSPETWTSQLREGEDYEVIDIRTPEETGLFTLSLPNSFAIPADQVFVPENLERIPTDKPVMIVCKSGTRATAIGTSLRHIGFDNVYILAGGFQGLASYYGPKQAYESPAEKTDP